MWSKLITSYNQVLCNKVAKLEIQRTFEERHVFKYWLSIQERKIPLRIVLIKHPSFEAAFFFCIKEILQVLCFSKLTLSTPEPINIKFPGPISYKAVSYISHQLIYQGPLLSWAIILSFGQDFLFATAEFLNQNLRLKLWFLRVICLLSPNSDYTIFVFCCSW